MLNKLSRLTVGKLMDRQILHSDMNSFYASVEIMLDPSLRNKPVAVCGSTAERHGIVLAKSELAKKAGVKTGMVNWEARQWCPQLVMIPPHYDQYLKYSDLARSIYGRYTDQIEPYGIDECWLDVSGSVVGNGEHIANTIRKTIREELGLTVSVGVSFNKVFAKLGSDMKKPDAITVISRENYKDTVWQLPASDLLYVGRATTKKLESIGVRTIGDLANAHSGMLRNLLGINGERLKMYALGMDQSRVAHQDFVPPIKSVGHGTTCIADLQTSEEVWLVMLELSQDIGHRLRINRMVAKGVQIAIRDEHLWAKQYQTQLQTATRSALDIARAAHALFAREYRMSCGIRSVTIRAINLAPQSMAQQTLLFDDAKRKEKFDKADTAVEQLRERYGRGIVLPAILLRDTKTGDDIAQGMKIPGQMQK